MGQVGRHVGAGLGGRRRGVNRGLVLAALWLLAACRPAPPEKTTAPAAKAPAASPLIVLAEVRAVDLRARVAMDRAVADQPALAAQLQARAPELIAQFRIEAAEEAARLAAAGVPRPRPYELDVVWRLEARAGDWTSLLRETRRTTGRARAELELAAETFHGAPPAPAPDAIAPAAARALERDACKAFRARSLERQAAAGAEPPLKAAPCPPITAAAVTFRAQNGVLQGAVVRWVVRETPGQPGSVYRLEAPLSDAALRAPAAPR